MGLHFELSFTSNDAEDEEVGNWAWTHMEQASLNTNAESRAHVLRLMKKKQKKKINTPVSLEVIITSISYSENF